MEYFLSVVVQQLNRRGSHEDVAGCDPIIVMDWIASTPLLFSHHCPPRCLSLTSRPRLWSATNPGVSHPSHLRLAFYSLSSVSFVLCYLQLTFLSFYHIHIRSISVSFFFFYLPFITTACTLHRYTAEVKRLKCFLGERGLDPAMVDSPKAPFPWSLFPHVLTHVKVPLICFCVHKGLVTATGANFSRVLTCTQLSKQLCAYLCVCLCACV